MRMTGKVKWFSPEKGFGFIVTDSGGDIMFRTTTLRDFGCTAIAEGTSVEFEAKEMARKPQFRSVAQFYAIGDPPPQSAPVVPKPRPLRAVMARDEPVTRAIGEVKSFSRAKGYGFIAAASEDVYVHRDVLRSHGMRTLTPGQRIEIEFATGPTGPTVTAIHATKRAARIVVREPAALPRVGIPAQNLLGEILWFEAELGFGAVSLAELDDVAFIDRDVLREAGLTGPHDCGKLVCEVEYAPPLLHIRRVSRLH